MRRSLRIPALALCVVALVSGGCRSHHAQAAPTYVMRVEAAEPDWDAPLPADVCFVASRKYEVTISSRSQLLHSLCDDIAAKYLPREPRRRWPPPYLRSRDVAPSVVCVLALGPDRVEIDYGPADSGRIDAEAICDSLRAKGWKRRPPWEGLDGPWPASD
jgi:hypothetical protein